MDDVIKLIAQSYTTNDYGVQVPTETSREIFCQVSDITRAEFFQAGRNGLNPSYTFSVFAGEYAGERLIEYNGARYAVYRTYHTPGTDYLELYVQREGGTNGKDKDNNTGSAG